MSQSLDLTGLSCPQPVLKTKRALARMAPGEILEVSTDDPHAVEDIRLFISQSAHRLEGQEADPARPGVTVHRIARKDGP